ncbi:hypothetical protein [Neobacillus sp. D3-1R]|uniref:hypothetical protein n=1 Tax=Neobacillus sp. D3-1R TaxID=3445778 RepID=UPI003F9EE1FF
MDQQRKQIIMKEIEYWKTSSLLPEHYCNFLLTLYSEGSHPLEEKEKKSHKVPFNLKNIGLFLIAFAVVFVIYFTELSFILQIAIYLTFIITGIFLIKYFYKKGLIPHLTFVFTAFVSLILSINIINHMGNFNTSLLYFVLFVHCFLWMIVGWKFRLIYFTISGILGVVTIIFSIFI